MSRIQWRLYTLCTNRLLTYLLTNLVHTASSFCGGRVNCGTDCWRRISIRCCESHCLRRIDPDVKIAFIESDRINRETARQAVVSHPVFLLFSSLSCWLARMPDSHNDSNKLHSLVVCDAVTVPPMQQRRVVSHRLVVISRRSRTKFSVILLNCSVGVLETMSLFLRRFKDSMECS